MVGSLSDKIEDDADEEDNKKKIEVPEWISDFFLWFKRHKVITITIVLLSAFFYIFRPWFHGLAMLFYIRGGAMLEGLAISFLIVYVIHKLTKDEGSRRHGSHSGFFYGFATFFLIFMVIFFGAFVAPSQGVSLYNNINEDIQEVETLPDVSENYIRILPKKVAKNYVNDSLQYPQYKVGNAGITLDDNKLQWSFSLNPGPFFVRWYDNPNKGAVFANMGTSSKDLKVFENDLEVGPKQLIKSSHTWQIYKDKYYIGLGKTFPILHNNEVYLATPYMRYKLKWTPVIHRYPVWKGVAMIDREGNIDYLSKEEALESDTLEGQQIFPEKLAKKWVQAFRYRNGLVNRLFMHKEEQVITDISGQGNKQPFLVKNEDGLKWITSAEPHGEDTHGVYEIYIIDAITGEIERWKKPPSESLIGPVKSVSYVKQAYPKFNWGGGSGEASEDTSSPKGFVAVEPLPIVVNSELYWQVKIIPESGAGVSRIVFVEADNPQNMVKVEREDLETSVSKFLKGEFTSKDIENKKETVQSLAESIVDLYYKKAEITEEINKKMAQLEEKIGDNLSIENIISEAVSDISENR